MTTAMAPKARGFDPVAAAAPNGPCSLLRMAVGGNVLAVPIEDVREILQVARMTPLPRTPDFIRGVMNLRGAVVPVIDLCARLGQGNATLGRRSCVVVVETTENQEPSSEVVATPVVMGLLVDAVFEVFDRGSAEIEATPALGTRIESQYLSGITRASGELIGVLSVAHVLSTQSLASSIASHVPH